MIIDCHGHYTTSPAALENWRNLQIANLNTPALGPKAADLKISDDELRESIEKNQLLKIKMTNYYLIIKLTLKQF